MIFAADGVQSHDIFHALRGDAGEHLKGRDAQRMVRESVFFVPSHPFTEQKKKEYLLYENHHSGLISFASPELLQY